MDRTMYGKVLPGTYYPFRCAMKENGISPGYRVVMPKPKKDQDYVKHYTETDVQNALNEIRNGMSKNQASKKFNVPRATLQFRLSSNYVKVRPGPSTVLTEREENELEAWLIQCSRKGFPKRRDDVLESVKEFLEKNPRQNTFINNTPGKGWYKLFLQRHPALSLRQSEAVTSASSKISENDLRKWFTQIHSYLEEMNYSDILSDPSRVFNGDETGFLFNPKNTAVIAAKGDRNVYDVEHAPSKTSLTVMFTFGADGDVTPPMIVYPLKRMRNEILQSVPQSWGVGMSENGWMKTETFFHYVKNVLHPYLVSKGTKFPIILFVDGHKSHTTLELSKLCEALQIILIALYPNATRLLQPADVSAFRPIKSAWRKAVLRWRKDNLTKTLTKVDFGPILNSIVENDIKPEIIKNGFRACGLVPWNPDAVDYSKCLGSKTLSNYTVAMEPVTLSYSQFQDIIGPTLKRRLDASNVGKSIEAKALLKINSYFKTMLEDPQRRHIDDVIEDEDLLTIDDKEREIEDQNDTETDLTDMQVVGSSELMTDEQTKDEDNEIKIFEDGCDNNMININGEWVHIENVEIMTTEDIILDSVKEVVSTDVISFVEEENTLLQLPAPESPRPSCSFANPATPETNKSISNTTITDFLELPKTPIRNNKQKTNKQPFVLTSKHWQQIETDKLNKKQQIESEKENRKRVREEKARVKKELIEMKKKKTGTKEAMTKKTNNPNLVKKSKIKILEQIIIKKGHNAIDDKQNSISAPVSNAPLESDDDDEGEDLSMRHYTTNSTNLGSQDIMSILEEDEDK